MTVWSLLIWTGLWRSLDANSSHFSEINRILPACRQLSSEGIMFLFHFIQLSICHQIVTQMKLSFKHFWIQMNSEMNYVLSMECSVARLCICQTLKLFQGKKLFASLIYPSCDILEGICEWVMTILWMFIYDRGGFYEVLVVNYHKVAKASLDWRTEELRFYLVGSVTIIPVINGTSALVLLMTTRLNGSAVPGNR